MVVVPDSAAGHHHIEVGVAGHDGGHVEVVGQHPQIGVPQQGMGDLLGGRAQVDADGGTVGDVFGQHLGDGLFFRQEQFFALLVKDVFRTQRHADTAVEALHLALSGQGVDILADGLRGHGKTFGELVDGRIATRIEHVQQGLVAFRCLGHGASWWEWGYRNILE